VLAATGGNIVGSIEVFMCRWPLANALLHMSNHDLLLLLLLLFTERTS
jgi:hypothetical protein